MNACQHKHTKYQPTDEEWRCPQCGATAQEGFIVYESINDMDNIECELLHPEDFLFCEKCNLETSGKAFAAFVVKKNSLVICPTCKGKGMVNKDSSTAHAAEVERLTAERDALDTALDQANADGEERRKEVVYWRSAFVKAGAERDAAVARAERAEACLRDAASKLSQVKEYLEDYFEGDRDHRYLGIQCIIEIGVKRITNMLADAVPSSPPADANKMEGERVRRLVELVEHLCARVVQREGRQVSGLDYAIRLSDGRCAFCAEGQGHTDTCILGLVEQTRSALAEMEGK